MNDMKEKIMKRQNVRTLSLIVCTFTYLLVGAAVFDALESQKEVERRDMFLKQEMELRNKYNISDKDFARLELNIRKNHPYYASKQQWKFSGSFYFALVVITVIGYGHSTPQTNGGKIFCMFYALAGIPLCIIMFQSVGERLNVFITYVLKHIRKCLRMGKREVPETHVILVTMNLSLIVLSCGAFMFAHYERWGYLESFYYCFITLTTIGFGDYVALQKEDMLQTKLHYVAFSFIFILFGLIVIAAAMNLLVLRFLTMNTEDERRDELEAAAAAQTACRLEGDVITSNGGVVSNAQERPEYSEIISVCSCSCYKWHSNKESETQKQRRNRIFTTSAKSVTSNKDENSSEETDSFLPNNYTKRSSV